MALFEQLSKNTYGFLELKTLPKFHSNSKCDDASIETIFEMLSVQLTFTKFRMIF